MSPTQKQNLGLFLGAIVVIGGLYWAYGAYQSKQVADAAWPALDGGIYTSAITRDGVTSLIPNDQLYDGGVLEGGIPALTNPKYSSVLASDSVISDSLMGIDVAINGEHRYYPVQIMNWHGVVNDTIGETDVAITYCPLCGTGIVYDRNADVVVGEKRLATTALTFSATGQVYNNNTILKDAETGSLWIQSIGTAVQGSAIGNTLNVIPSQMMDWGTWKAMYPSGLVLSVDTGVARDYARHPYGGYDTGKGVYFPLNHMSPDFASKWVVYGIGDAAGGLGFATEVLKGTGIMTAKLGDATVLAVYDYAIEAIRVFQTSEAFTFDFAKKRLTDTATGSVWNARGLAISGDMKGTQLVEIPSVRGFWFCLAAMHPTWKAVTTNIVTE